MPYNYAEFRPKVFTEEGVEMLTKMRENARKHLKEAGAVRADKIMKDLLVDQWLQLAGIDYMVEKKELIRVTPVGSVAAQHQVFTARNL